ncbi:restriction endonuclease [Lysinibacillus sp. NPDC093197]|uniref:restriction endonuclease n=1 Tax=Lysinibacillus sp. NPDC093197 TaxID=3364132 RepID=UPI00382C645C
MGRKSSIRKLRRAKKSNAPSTILAIVVLFIMGKVIADNINPLQDDVSSTLVLLFFLIAIIIGLFRYMGLHQVFRITPRIRYWNLKQKSIFGLYLFFIVLMISEIFPHGEILALFFFLGLFYIGIRSIIGSYKNSNAVLSPLLLKKRSKYCHVNIEEIDKMGGTEFEEFLSELYYGLGYYAEVTPHNDYGVDVIIIKDKIKTGIQAKCYGEGRRIGVEAVNEICGGAGYWKAQKKKVITNRYFTKKALNSAKANNVEMVDRDGLQLLIKEYQLILQRRGASSFFSFIKRWKHR